MKLSESLKTPSWIVFQLLEKCNLRCNMCYEWGETGAYHEFEKLAMLDFEVLKKTIQECLPGKPAFEFFGGEPMLYPGIWEAIQLIRERGCDVAFPTNGTLLEKHAELLVETGPSCVWVSLDGPKTINDLQRGQGVYQKAMDGLQKVHDTKLLSGTIYPELGVTYVVTPDNYLYVEDFFLKRIDLELLSCVSIELQSYATNEQVNEYENILREQFDITDASCAKAYVRATDFFRNIDAASLARQMRRIAEECRSKGIAFYSQPKTLAEENLTSYLTGNWHLMKDKKNRCGVPWVTAEISARGDVTTCHSFYDLPIGNIYQQSLLDIWQGERLRGLQAYLRHNLFPICTACCRYYSGAGTQATGK